MVKMWEQLKCFQCTILGEACLDQAFYDMKDTHEPDCSDCMIYLDKKQLMKVKEINKESLEEGMIDIGGYLIPEKLITEYCYHIVSMLRRLIKSPMEAVAVGPMYIYKLELKRKEYHNKILEYLDIKRDSKESREFDIVMENFLEDIGVGL